MHTREACVAADRLDPLASIKNQFDLPPGVIYLDGNSLGVLPRTAARAADVIGKEWGAGLIRSWNTAGWFDLPARLGDKLAGLIGAGKGEVVITDTTSLNIFKALAAALRIQQQARPGRRVILSERDNFPTDLYMIQGMIDLLQQGYEMRLIDDELPLEQALDDSVAVVLLSHVNYRSGQMHDMRAVTALAHERGALTIWDLAHAAGAVPVDLQGAKADFAVGCTYKYLNGGPGAPASSGGAAPHRQFLAAADRLVGHQRPFDDRGLRAGRRHPPLPVRHAAHRLAVAGRMRPGHRPRRRHRRSPQEVAGAGRSVHRAGRGTLRRPSADAGHAARATLRGSHVSFRHPNGFEVMQALIARGVIGDYREPEVLRFGLTPLYLGHADVWDAVEVLKDVLDTRAWDKPEFKHRAAVT